MEDKESASTREVVSNGNAANTPTPRRKRGVINTLYPPGPKPGAGGRIRNHCRRFWWCDLLVLVMVVLVIVLPIIYVGIPNKAQHDLNASTLEVTEQDVTSPTSDGIHLKLVTVARSGSAFHPTIDGFKGGLSLKDQEPFIYIDVPKTKADTKVDIVVDQNVTINSNAQFNNYNKVVMQNETFDVYLKGKTKMHLSGLSGISVDYTKKVTMKGLNKLSGLNITGIKILSGAFGDNAVLADGSNMVGNVSIPNPTVMTLDLGNVTMNLAVNGTGIGYSLLPNLVLKPGTNIVPMQATTQQIAILGLIQSSYKDGVIPLDISGNSSIKNGQHLEYYEEAIKSNTVRVNLNTKPALEAIGLGSVFNKTST